jgi:hypothetical protein
VDGLPIDRLQGTQSFLTGGYRFLFPGIKRQGRETDNSRPTFAEVKQAWLDTPTYQQGVMEWHLIKLRNDCTFMIDSKLMIAESVRK